MDELKVTRLPSILTEDEEGRERMQRLVDREEERKREIEKALGPEGLKRLEAAWEEIERRFLVGDGA